MSMPNSYHPDLMTMAPTTPTSDSYDPGAVVYDFTIYKLNKMIDELKVHYEEHPDMYILDMMLDAYVEGSLAIYWVGGYPMANL